MICPEVALVTILTPLRFGKVRRSSQGWHREWIISEIPQNLESNAFDFIQRIRGSILRICSSTLEISQFPGNMNNPEKSMSKEKLKSSKNRRSECMPAGCGKESRGEWKRTI